MTHNVSTRRYRLYGLYALLTGDPGRPPIQAMPETARLRRDIGLPEVAAPHLPSAFSSTCGLIRMWR